MPIDGDDGGEEEDGPQGIQHPPGWTGPKEQSGQKVRPFSSRLCPLGEHSDNHGHLKRATPRPSEAAWVSKARGWKGPLLLLGTQPCSCVTLISISTYCVPRPVPVSIEETEAGPAALFGSACGHTVEWQQRGMWEKHGFWSYCLGSIPRWLCTLEQVAEKPRASVSSSVHWWQQLFFFDQVVVWVK